MFYIDLLHTYANIFNLYSSGPKTSQTIVDTFRLHLSLVQSRYDECI